MEACHSPEKSNEMSVYDNTTLNSQLPHSSNTSTETSLMFHVNTQPNSNDDYDVKLIELDTMEEHDNLPPANFDSVINGQISHVPLRRVDPGLIGDYSEPFCLPVINGKQKDLTCISVYTMAKLMKGEYTNTVNSYRVIDCRYPYEYDGGHIKGAENFYTEKDIYRFPMSTETETVKPMRNIIIFHCEFSSRRGPKLAKFLRTKDRLANKNNYPALRYPEIYLLDGGYKEFYKCYNNLCEPMAYLPMLDPAYVLHYKRFQAERKSWDSDRVTRSRSGKSWSRLSF